MAYLIYINSFMIKLSIFVVVLFSLLAEVSSMSLKEYRTIPYPFLAGTRFRITNGAPEEYKAIITFSSNFVTWQQYNFYGCKFQVIKLKIK